MATKANSPGGPQSPVSLQSLAVRLLVYPGLESQSVLTVCVCVCVCGVSLTRLLMLVFVSSFLTLRELVLVRSFPY